MCTKITCIQSSRDLGTEEGWRKSSHGSDTLFRLNRPGLGVKGTAHHGRVARWLRNVLQQWPGSGHNCGRPNYKTTHITAFNRRIALCSKHHCIPLHLYTTLTSLSSMLQCVFTVKSKVLSNQVNSEPNHFQLAILGFTHNIKNMRPKSMSSSWLSLHLNQCSQLLVNTTDSLLGTQRLCRTLKWNETMVICVLVTMYISSGQ